MALPAFLPDRMEPQKNLQNGGRKKEQSHRESKLSSKPESKTEQKPKPKPKPKPKQKSKQKQKPPSSWDHFKNLLTCKQMEGSRVHNPSKVPHRPPYLHPAAAKLGNSCGSICRFRDVAEGNTTVVYGAGNFPDDSSVSQETRLLTRKSGTHGSSSRTMTASTRSNVSAGSQYSSSRTMHFRKLSGCYECHMIVDPSRYPISPRICACSICGEVFPKLESLELHQAVRHAVSELGPEDSGRNIVEIIFKSSWLKKDSPIYKIERILKVHNTQRTIQRFEDCRDAIKARALQGPKKDPRCAADGNELLRFHCTTLACSLGARGSSSLCGSVPGCGVCTVIRHGFQGKPGGSIGHAGDVKVVRTTASSGKAHDSIQCTDTRRAMLVCRVIAGRVKRVGEGNGLPVEDLSGAYDSVAGQAGLYSNLEELHVFNPKAILPCFVVIYKVLES